MPLLERYLRAVEFWLPEEGRTDILAELAEDLQSEIEDREEELGRPLVEDELVAVLRAHGHPFLVAARYGPRRGLIGPGLYPLYVFTLKVVLLWVLLPLFLASSVLSLVVGANPWRDLFQGRSGVWEIGWTAVVTITIGFVIADRSGLQERLFQRFDPRRLPRVERPRHQDRMAREISRLVGRVVLTIWAVAALAGGVVYRDTSAQVLVTPAWRVFFWPALVLALAAVGGAVAAVVRPAASAGRAYLGLATSLAGLVLVLLLLRAAPGLDLSSPTAAAPALVMPGLWLNLAMNVVLGVAGAILLFRFVQRVRLVLRRRPARLAEMLATALVLVCVPAAGAHAQERAGVAGAPSLGAAVSDSAIRAILADRVDGRREAVGIVVGVVSPAGRRVVSYGFMDRPGGRPVDGATLFEIGSITKLFGAILLADMVRAGEVSLDDPVAKYLPADVRMPVHGRPITLADLATHTSGLPFWPPDFPPAEDTAEYSHYTTDRMYRSLERLELTRDPGTWWEYSNFGGGLLGAALARRAGTDYASLVRARITRPLGMDATTIEVPARLRSRLALGHDPHLAPARSWDVPALPGAGSLRSSADDLLRLLAAFTGNQPSALAPALAALPATRRPNAMMPPMQQALGWFVLPLPGGEILIHGGGTLGFASSIACDPATHTGVVVLSNARGSVDDIARHVLRSDLPLSPAGAPPAPRHGVALDTAQARKVAGRYEAGPGIVFLVERAGPDVLVTLPMAPRTRLHAGAQGDFFLGEGEVTMRFETDGTSAATRMVLNVPGLPPIPAQRLPDPRPAEKAAPAH